jgi:hypothetical protein
VKLDDPGHQALHVRRHGDVGADEARVAAGVANRRGRPLAAVGIGIGEDDLSAFGGEELRGGAADARGAAGDQRDLAREPVGNACLR